jgi:hypothetical protein
VLDSRLAFAVLLVACNPHGPEKTELRGEDCLLCHAAEVERTRQPPHAELGFGERCGDCHDQASWRPAAGFVHVESFPLTFGHDGPGCASCHQHGYTAETVSTECVDCHAARAAEVVDPVHEGLDESCFACHRTDAFYPARFVHSWPLEGQQTLPSCGSCHPGKPARYAGTCSACIDCHADDRARADVNVTGHSGFPDDCASCHGFEAF